MARAAAIASLQDQWREAAVLTQGHAGIAALVIETGEGTGLNAQEHFPMQSVYKLPIAMAIMSQVDQDALSLNQIVTIGIDDMMPTGRSSLLRDRFPHGVGMTLGNLMRYSLVESDNTASDVLLRLAGGPERVTAYLRAAGIEGMVIATSEKDNDWTSQYDNWATPEASVALLKKLQDGELLTPPARNFLLELMHANRTSSNRIRALLPPGTDVEDKTGTSDTKDGITAATNDIGLITLPDGNHLALAIYLRDSQAPQDKREGFIAEAARAAWAYWAGIKVGRE